MTQEREEEQPKIKSPGKFPGDEIMKEQITEHLVKPWNS